MISFPAKYQEEYQYLYRPFGKLMRRFAYGLNLLIAISAVIPFDNLRNLVIRTVKQLTDAFIYGLNFAFA